MGVIFVITGWLITVHPSSLSSGIGESIFYILRNAKYGFIGTLIMPFFVGT